MHQPDRRRPRRQDRVRPAERLQPRHIPQGADTLPQFGQVDGLHRRHRGGRSGRRRKAPPPPDCRRHPRRRRHRLSPAADRRASIRVRSSMKWTALTGVPPATVGWSLKGTRTVTVNVCVALFEPPRSVTVTVASAVPAATGRHRQRVPAHSRPPPASVVATRPPAQCRRRLLPCGRPLRASDRRHLQERKIARCVRCLYRLREIPDTAEAQDGNRSAPETRTPAATALPNGRPILDTHAVAGSLTDADFAGPRPTPSQRPCGKPRHAATASRETSSQRASPRSGPKSPRKTARCEPGSESEKPGSYSG